MSDPSVSGSSAPPAAGGHSVPAAPTRAIERPSAPPGRSDGPRREDRRFTLAAVVAIAVGLTALLFGVYRTSSVIGAATRELDEDAIPSEVELESAGAELRALVPELETLLAGGPVDRSLELGRIDRSRRALSEHTAAYASLPRSPGESVLVGDVETTTDELQHVVDRIVAAGPVEPRTAGANDLRAELDRSAARLDRALVRASRFNSDLEHRLVASITTARREWLPFTAALSILSVVVAIAALAVGRQALRHALVLEERSRELQERRADELDAFSGRIAHDLLSPLMTVSLALGLAEQRIAAGGDEQLGTTLRRASGSLMRVKRLVDGLLEFARAGASPLPGVRTRLQDVIAEVVADVEPVAAAAGVAIERAGATDVEVPCNPGVVTSMLANLVQNSIKYLADSPVRRVVVRSSASASRVRVEVEDTGPGIAASMLPTLFQPYTRAPDTRQPGLGLGLATVRRLALAHGGEVGVISKEGSGSTFWFELPRAA